MKTIACLLIVIIVLMAVGLTAYEHSLSLAAAREQEALREKQFMDRQEQRRADSEAKRQAAHEALEAKLDADKQVIEEEDRRAAYEQQKLKDEEAMGSTKQTP